MWHPFDNISEELVDAIVSLCGRRTLANLCRVSKQLNRIATPHLYANITLNADIGGEGALRHLRPLAHRTFADPSFASLVKSIALPEGWGGCESAPRLDCFKVKPWPRIETPETEQLLERICREYYEDETKALRMYIKLYAADADVIITLLVANLPNLERLDLEFGEFRDHKLFCEMIKGSAGRLEAKKAASLNSTESSLSPTAPLPKPVDVFIRDSEAGDVDYLASFFHLPNLRSMYAFKFGDDDENISTMERNPFALLGLRSCGVQYIELRASSLATHTLQHLIEATIPGNLKAFLYERACSLTSRSAELPFLMRCLEDHQDHLETLALGYEEIEGCMVFEHTWWEFFDRRPAAMSFTSFKSLRRLRVAPETIWGYTHDECTVQYEEDIMLTIDMFWKALPASLEELWLTRLQHHWIPGFMSHDLGIIPNIFIPALDRLVEESSKACPHLRSICIELLPNHWEVLWLDELAECCHDAERRGIHCTVIFLYPRDVNSDFRRSEAVERGWGWNEDVEWSEISMNANKTWRKHVIHAAKENDLKGKMRALQNSSFEYVDNKSSLSEETDTDDDLSLSGHSGTDDDLSPSEQSDTDA
ncbi:uncharacterized protein J4E84_006838 [Alternaria hordeiaustralica]|uniref:uncharacterized protein n=1 Tax=Alternaria hordeiaustralica TaxID=1187925 RepID=UPI0020C4095F|nr:uncharacterized protein J4E84_006838 [Alternaria hordeiaustralica]KAI4683998.1 hypothetical protein J4E84_006838 [Alternaria hordeiaustralica]